MKLSVEFVFRMIGMVIFAFLGWGFGAWAARIPPFDPRARAGGGRRRDPRDGGHLARGYRVGAR